MNGIGTKLGMMQVPVLIDGDKVLKDSFDIALYLEKAYPDGPTLFGSKEGEAAARYADNYAIWAFGGDYYYYYSLHVSDHFASCQTFEALKIKRPHPDWNPACVCIPIIMITVL